MTERIVMAAVGDVMVERDTPRGAFRDVQRLLDEADLRFGNCEGTYSDTSERNASSWGLAVLDPKNVEALSAARFDVMTLANNHTMDGGYSGLSDMLTRLHDADIATVGAGMDLDEARRPALVERRGMRVGFLGYTSVHPPGFEASPGRPGCATLKIHTIYEQELGHPGTPPQVTTVADPRAKAQLLADVAAARALCDQLVVTFHWGIHNVRAVLADYERELGQAVIDAGADVVLGHSQHVIKGVELYRGKPIFYGIGNFILDGLEARRAAWIPRAQSSMRDIVKVYGKKPLEEIGSTEKSDTNRSMLVRCTATGGAFSDYAIVPCHLGPNGGPAPMEPGSDDFAAYVEYLQAITAEAGLNARYVVDGQQIRVVEGDPASAAKEQGTHATA